MKKRKHVQWRLYVDGSLIYEDYDKPNKMEFIHTFCEERAGDLGFTHDDAMLELIESDVKIRRRTITERR